MKLFRLVAFDGEVSTASDVLLTVQAEAVDPYEVWLAESEEENGEVTIDGRIFSTLELYINFPIDPSLKALGRLAPDGGFQCGR